MDLRLTFCIKICTFDSQCGHDEVSRGVDPVGGLHPVGAPDPGHAWVAVQVHVKLELPDEVK